jgi:hypothetical protein
MVSGRALIQRVAPGHGVSVQQMLDRVSRILGRVSDRRAAGDINLVGGAAARVRHGVQRSLANSREVRHRWLRH